MVIYTMGITRFIVDYSYCAYKWLAIVPGTYKHADKVLAIFIISIIYIATIVYIVLCSFAVLSNWRPLIAWLTNFHRNPDLCCILSLTKVEHKEIYLISY